MRELGTYWEGCVLTFNDRRDIIVFCFCFFFCKKMFTGWLFLYTVSNMDQTDFQYLYSDMYTCDTD